MGRPKALLPFGPERLLQRVVRLVATVAKPILVIAAADQELPDLPDDVAVIRDPVAGRGPLQGLAAGLAALPESIELVYGTATDVPFLEPRWINRLAELIGDADLAIARIDQEYHPLAALYRRSAVLPAIEHMLREDRLRMTSLVERVPTRVVDERDMRGVDPRLWTLRNLNDPDEYRRALVDAGLSDA